MATPNIKKPTKSVVNTEPEIDGDDEGTAAQKTVKGKKLRTVRPDIVETILEAVKAKAKAKASKPKSKPVIDSRTSNQSLGQFALRADAIGRQARAERDRRLRAKQPPKVKKTEAYKTLSDHLTKGGKHQDLLKVAHTLKDADPHKIAKIIKQAVVTRETQKAAKSREASIAKAAVMADRARRAKEKRAAEKRAKEKAKAEAALRAKLARETKRVPPTQKVSPAAHTLRNIPDPVLPPPHAPHAVNHPTPEKIVLGVVPKKVIIGPDGKEYDDQTHYVSVDGQLRTWQWFKQQNDPRFSGESGAYPHEFPDHKLYGKDPRLPKKEYMSGEDSFILGRLKKKLPKTWR
jgi:hypothetical protein